MRHHALSHDPMALAAPGRAVIGPAVRFVFDRFLLLPAGAAVALVWANTAPEGYYQLSQLLAFPVNEIGMAVFLALVVHEVFEAIMPGGALHTWRRWLLPVVAAMGGVAATAGTYLVYVGASHETVLAQAWPIACAVDVAAAYYVIKLIFRRGAALPFVLLTALATDAVGVLVLMTRPRAVDVWPGAVALLLAGIAAAALMRRLHVRRFWPYFAAAGPLCWLALYLGGVHPALALVPIVPFLPREPRSLELFAEPDDDDPLHHAEREWNVVAQVVLLLFGLVNGGVILRHYDTGTWAMLSAALVGRPIGIIAAVAGAVACGLRRPRGLGWRELGVIAMATSSGFTFALFLATGLIAIGPVLSQVALGALSTVAGAALTVLLARLLHVGRFAER
ncbi:MAG TPA: Na+/H+ antiporter NhaA [Vicinamibacterales bacterium]|nr:Na+/H+ antiporter NhaA [Vicinamibacterales bacterium]